MKDFAQWEASKEVVGKNKLTFVILSVTIIPL